MRIVVTGAAGFLGRMVVEAIDRAETVMLDGASRPFWRWTSPPNRCPIWPRNAAACTLSPGG